MAKSNIRSFLLLGSNWSKQLSYRKKGEVMTLTIIFVLFDFFFSVEIKINGKDFPNFSISSLIIKSLESNKICKKNLTTLCFWLTDLL